MRAVNLLPKDTGRARGAGAKRGAPKHLPLLVGGVLGALVCGFLGLQTMSASGAISDREAQLQDLNAMIAATPAPPAGPPPATPSSRTSGRSGQPRSPPRSRAASRGTGCCAASRSSCPTTSG